MDAQQQENTSLLYTGIVPDAAAKEWLEATHKDLLVQRWMEGKLVGIYKLWSKLHKAGL